MHKEHTEVNDTKAIKKQHKTSKRTGLLVPVKKRQLCKMTKRITDELDRGFEKPKYWLGTGEW